MTQVKTQKQFCPLAYIPALVSCYLFPKSCFATIWLFILRIEKSFKFANFFKIFWRGHCRIVKIIISHQCCVKLWICEKYATFHAGLELDFLQAVAQVFYRGAYTNKEKHSAFENSRRLPQLIPNGFNSAALRNTELKICVITAK